MLNQDIREEIKNSSLKLWQIADGLGITDGNFSRKLRKELPDSEKQKIRCIILNLKKEGQNYDSKNDDNF